MRRAGKVDLDQALTVKALRDAGACVQVLSSFGHGVPDLLVSWRGYTVLIELKTGNAKLTQDEAEWHAKWAGRIIIARSPEEAVRGLVKAWEERAA